MAFFDPFKGPAGGLLLVCIQVLPDRDPEKRKRKNRLLSIPASIASGNVK